jgi:hypothetical protein
LSFRKAFWFFPNRRKRWGEVFAIAAGFLRRFWWQKNRRDIADAGFQLFQVLEACIGYCFSRRN